MFDCHQRALHGSPSAPDGSPAYLVVDARHQTYPVELAQIAAPGRRAARWTDLNPLNPEMVDPRGGWFPIQVGQRMYLPDDWSLQALADAGYETHARERGSPPPSDAQPPPLARPGPMVVGCGAHHLASPHARAPFRRAKARAVEVVFLGEGDPPARVCTSETPAPCTARTCELYDPRELDFAYVPAGAVSAVVRVRDCESNAPLQGTRVWLHGPAEAESITDGRGVAYFAVQPGTYGVRADHPDYVESQATLEVTARGGGSSAGGAGRVAFLVPVEARGNEAPAPTELPNDTTVKLRQSLAAALTILDLDDPDRKAVRSAALAVGVQVSLRVQGPRGATPTEIEWTISDDAIAEFEPTETSAVRKDLDKADKSRQDIRFFWITGGDKDVTVKATVNGRSMTCSAIFTVFAPQSVTMTSETGTPWINPDGEGHEPWLEYGNVRKKPGIRFKFGALLPVPGEIAGAQLAAGHSTRTVFKDGPYREPLYQDQCSTVSDPRHLDESAFCLDNEFPYAAASTVGRAPAKMPALSKGGLKDFQWVAGEWKTSDTPGVRLSIDKVNGSSTPTKASEASVASAFAMFFLYRPTWPDKKTCWVALGVLRWRFGAFTGFDGKKWLDPPEWVDPQVNPSGVEGPKLPKWTKNIRDVDWKKVSP
jgi:hypothetical protein